MFLWHSDFATIENCSGSIPLLMLSQSVSINTLQQKSAPKLYSRKQQLLNYLSLIKILTYPIVNRFIVYRIDMIEENEMYLFYQNKTTDVKEIMRLT